MAPTKKGGEKQQGRSALNEAATKEHTNIQSASMDGLPETYPAGTQRRGNLKEMGTPDVCVHARLNTAVRARGVRTVP